MIGALRQCWIYLVAVTVSVTSGCEPPPNPADIEAPPSPFSVEPNPDDPAWPPDTPLPDAFDFPPWLNMPSPGRVVVSWRTTEKSTGGVILTSPVLPEQKRTFLSTEVGHLHHVDLGVLAAGRAYHYRVFVDPATGDPRSGTDITRDGVFTTPGRDRWRFVQIAEFHAPTHSADVAAFAPAIRDFRPHVLIDSGDMVNTGTDFEQWRSYMRTSAPWISNVIFLPSHSNHVNGFQGNVHLKSLFVLPNNERWYTTRYGQVLFFNLDSTYDRADNPDTHLQPEWIAEKLAEADDGIDDPVFIIGAWHYPACSSSYLGRQSSREWIRENFIAAFGDLIDLILVGHDKYYERSLLDGEITHVQSNAGKLAPSTESDYEPECTSWVVDTATRSMVFAEVSPSPHKIDITVTDSDCNAIDEFTIRARIQPSPVDR